MNRTDSPLRDMANNVRSLPTAQADRLANAIKVIGDGREIWLNHWWTYDGNSRKRVVVHVFHSRAEAEADCAPPTWSGGRAGELGQVYIVSFHYSTDGTIRAHNLAALEEVRT